MARKDILDDHGFVKSDLWVDDKNALEVLQKCTDSNELDTEMLTAMSDFIVKGYAVIDLNLSQDFLCRSTDNVHKIITERPRDLLGAQIGLNNGRPMPLSYFNDEFQPKPGFRLLDSHSHVPEFEILMTNQKLHRFVQLVLGQTCVASQSLCFLYGSNQSLHRDPWFVVTTPIANMMAAWIALEDIDPDSGPLTFVPGSHRLPYKPLPSGDIVFHDPQVTEENRSDHRKHMTDMMEAHGLNVETFSAKKGQALIWHSSLIHGGSVVRDPSKTRKSFVIHYDALANHRSHAQSIRIGDEKPWICKTTRIENKKGRYWFPNPLAEHYITAPDNNKPT